MAIEQLTKGNTDGTVYGQVSTEKIGFYGITAPVSRRSGTIQATSIISATTFTTVNTNSAAILLEIAQTLVALGIWNGA